jgi:hypothetical protein
LPKPIGKSVAFSAFLHAQGANPVTVEEYIRQLSQEALLKPHEDLVNNLALGHLQILAYKAALAIKNNP